jgi:hypothetical protein
MKTIQTVLILFIMYLSIPKIHAQYGNNGYGNNGYGNNGYGRNNGMSQMNQSREPQKPKEIPVEETVAKIMERLKPLLNLDALQEIAISNVLAESIKSQGIFLKDESANQEQKIKEIKALSETTDRKINEFLNEDQKEKFKILNEENPNAKKSRKRK